MIRQLTPMDVNNLLIAGEPVMLLDVREPEEYAICRLPGSVLIPLGELPSRLGEIDVPEGGTVVVYCHHGIRSNRAAAFLHQQGIENAVNMSGGIEWWSQQIDPSVPRY
jgi:rhodanese-related sulfurtransferase